MTLAQGSMSDIAEQQLLSALLTADLTESQLPSLPLLNTPRSEISGVQRKRKRRSASVDLQNLQWPQEV